nr:histone lysine N methyltransferase PRDM9 [Hymenolepis microstoma]
MAEEKRFEEKRCQKAWSRSRPLFSRPLSDSDDSDWASSDDEWFPVTSPTLESYRSRKRSKSKKNGNKIVSEETPKVFTKTLREKTVKISKPPFSKPDTTGGLMELQEVRNYQTRNITRKNYKDPPADPQDDRFLYCYECKNMYVDPCPTHPILWIKSVKPLLCDAVETGKPDDCCCGKDERNHSRRTAPECFVHVGQSSIRGAGLGVWAEKEIPIGAIFGPYTGEIVPLEDILDQELKKRSRLGYAWLVRGNHLGTKSHLVDAFHPVLSNWLRVGLHMPKVNVQYVNCARHDEEQNLVTIQYRGKIYYRACQTIKPGYELLTYYGDKFAKELGIISRSTAHNDANEQDSSSLNLKCGDCDKEFRNRPLLMTHLKTHSTFAAFKCDKCKERFKFKRSLNSHMLKHAGLKPYACSHCEKSFSQSGNLRIHISSVHKGSSFVLSETIFLFTLRKIFLTIRKSQNTHRFGS